MGTEWTQPLTAEKPYGTGEKSVEPMKYIGSAPNRAKPTITTASIPCTGGRPRETATTTNEAPTIRRGTTPKGDHAKNE